MAVCAAVWLFFISLLASCNRHPAASSSKEAPGFC